MDVYYDSFQEGAWFKELHPKLSDATLYPFPNGAAGSPGLRQALMYDRPDIILVDNGRPILVIERTVEVPSGHNVGQRFGRLVAAAQMQVPVVYFGPYAAYKHGGETRGPRYMNLRLFYALNELSRIENTAVTTINWPVDQHFEIIQTPSIRDKRIKEYLDLFFDLYDSNGLPRMISLLMKSQFQQDQLAEQKAFAARWVRRPGQYDSPPDSVIIAPLASIPALAAERPRNLTKQEIVFYNVGMNYIRSDPYAGAAMLYAYLYCGGMSRPTRNLVLYFPNITKEIWRATPPDRKDIRLFKLTSDGILFSDGYLPQAAL